MKLRFAPSPTGFLHVGGARTAIFNLLHARRHGGAMLLRIEDTDVERSRQHHAEQIVTSLQWLGVAWEDGPVYQSDRLDRYRERAEELVQRGRAYRCYCTIEELEADRVAAGDTYRYSGRCRAVAERRDALSTVEPFDVTTSEQALRKLAESRGVTAGKYIHPLRVALTGKAASPPIFDVLAVLGKDRALRRLQRLVNRLPELSQ
jgi:glutamyl/glutaminyl-tRNA synthetase